MSPVLLLSHWRPRYFGTPRAEAKLDDAMQTGEFNLNSLGTTRPPAPLVCAPHKPGRNVVTDLASQPARRSFVRRQQQDSERAEI